MSNEVQKTRCANKGCQCDVNDGQTYCGPHCANAAADSGMLTERHCDCGHESCRQLPDVPL